MPWVSSDHGISEGKLCFSPDAPVLQNLREYFEQAPRPKQWQNKFCRQCPVACPCPFKFFWPAVPVGLNQLLNIIFFTGPYSF